MTPASVLSPTLHDTHGVLAGSIHSNLKQKRTWSLMRLGQLSAMDGSVRKRSTPRTNAHIRVTGHRCCRQRFELECTGSDKK